MKKVFACGSQNTGKTTFMNELHSRLDGDSYLIDGVATRIKNSEHYSQEMMYKVIRDISIFPELYYGCIEKGDYDYYLYDRSLIDVYVYTILSDDDMKINLRFSSKSVDDYVEDIIESFENSLILYFPRNPDIALVDNGVRNIDREIIEKTDYLFDETIVKYKNNFNLKVLTIDTKKDVEYNIKLVNEELKKLMKEGEK